MKRLSIRYIAVILTGLLVAGCNVHEFPDSTEAPGLAVNLRFDLGMPVHEIVPYPQARAGYDAELRYTLWGWNLDNGEEIDSRNPDITIQWSGSDLSRPDVSRQIDDITPGAWKFFGWADLADAETKQPIAYNIESPSDIKLITTNEGGFDAVPWADAFRGEGGAAICCAEQKDMTIEMSRPVGAFEFISTDMEKFMEEQTRRHSGDSPADAPSKAVDLNNYVVGYHINGFFPTEFDNLRNIPVDARTGLYSSGKISVNNDGTGNLGGCYMLVNGHETTVSVTVRVYEGDTAIATSLPVEVPVVRGKKTIIRGEFLTANAGSGIGINPGFDGEYNYVVE